MARMMAMMPYLIKIFVRKKKCSFQTNLKHRDKVFGDFYMAAQMHTHIAVSVTTHSRISD